MCLSCAGLPPVNGVCKPVTVSCTSIRVASVTPNVTFFPSVETTLTLLFLIKEQYGPAFSFLPPFIPGRRRSGKTYRAGGCGCLIDDEGSGYAIGRDVLKAVVRAFDGRSAPTVLTEKVLSFLQIDRIDDIVKFVHSPATDKKRIAELSALCAAAADENDSAAISILTKAAEELSLLVIPVLRNLNLPKGPLVLTGSVLQKDRIVPVKLKAVLARTFPELEYAQAPDDAAAGAALLALRSVVATGCA
ncbi:ATPase BadF/BadG/BcrA/BcrD type [Treponema brennaborense DSM 12168]|uniref:ATPase BadF/BadG/BcrA/BcrD type n=1 Tax=Treponema brennaborense (strain DSM 12168 / CIP 105900 / DD5/3) TaxID=906968 RepID=F4LQB3_TREBD|nr:ATPase BadF/BadG/BcrA/BcrD type [Treponema brennaborense DSM 12168]